VSVDERWAALDEGINLLDDSGEFEPVPRGRKTVNVRISIDDFRPPKEWAGQSEGDER
jgi:hypothetical protein